MPGISHLTFGFGGPLPFSKIWHRVSIELFFQLQHQLSTPEMRNTLIFAGSSCPALTGQICSNLGMAPAGVELSQFANVPNPASPYRKADND